MKTEKEIKASPFVSNVGNVGNWPMWLARHDNLPPGCLKDHLDRIITRPGGVKSADLGRQAVVTLWFIAFALATIGLCAWLIFKAAFVV